MKILHQRSSKIQRFSKGNGKFLPLKFVSGLPLEQNLMDEKQSFSMEVLITIFQAKFIIFGQ